MIGRAAAAVSGARSLHNGAIVGYLMGRHADSLAYRPDAPEGLLAYVLYRWEIILRESAIFGILGILTLGYYVDAAIAEIRLDVAMVLILATALLSMAVDALSRGLRRRLRIDTMPTRLSDAPSEMRLARPAGALNPASRRKCSLRQRLFDGRLLGFFRDRDIQ
jgi:phosphonate transport system permease protein